MTKSLWVKDSPHPSALRPLIQEAAYLDWS